MTNDIAHRQEPQTVSVAIAMTGHYEFIAVGATPEAARAAIYKGWDEHVRITGADPDYLTDDAINIVTGPLGQVWRDYSPFPRKD